MKRALLIALVLMPLAVSAIDPQRLDDPAQEARYRQLITELRCLVCQNQTLADSNAPLAIDLRDQVRARIEAGASDEEIVEYLTARYGDFVLYRPPFNAVTAILWLAPLLLLLIGIGFAVRFTRGARASRPPVDADQRARIRALLEERDR